MGGIDAQVQQCLLNLCAVIIAIASHPGSMV
jgi:hypothetical protein